jgi:hypothetical protein
MKQIGGFSSYSIAISVFKVTLFRHSEFPSWEYSYTNSKAVGGQFYSFSGNVVVYIVSQQNNGGSNISNRFGI